MRGGKAQAVDRPRPRPRHSGNEPQVHDFEGGEHSEEEDMLVFDRGMVKKAKLCVQCGRIMTWRKKWEKDWAGKSLHFFFDVWCKASCIATFKRTRACTGRPEALK